MTKSTGTLRTLVQLLSDAVNRIEDKYSAAGLDLPSLEDPFDITQPSNALLLDPTVVQQASVVVAAAEQLSVFVRPPQFVILEGILSYHQTSALGAVEAGNVVEILREAGSNGLHVKDISAKNGIDADKLARILRLLATYHIFNEVSPDVFSNNRVSSVLDTLKPSSELSTPPTVSKYTGTNGMAALAGHAGDEAIRSGAFVTKFLTKKPADPTIFIDSPFNRAFNEFSCFSDWLHSPGNEIRASRIHEGMKGTDDGGAILRGFPWESLPSGSKVVDVGGGLGSVSFTVAQKFPELNFVIQDQPKMNALAEDFWKGASPESLRSGRVVIQGHDFFQPQPVKDADLFMLRFVLHDWPHALAVKILKQLRDAATPGKTKLLLADNIVNYACKNTTGDEIEGNVSPPAPEPLLANFGRASITSYQTDLQMLVVQNGQERTIGDHISVTKESGWKITHVYSPPGSIIKQILAEAI